MIATLKDALQELRTAVEIFAAQCDPGDVTIGEGNWLNTTLPVLTTPALAEALSKLPGIAKVEAPRTLTPDTARPLPKARPKGPGF